MDDIAELHKYKKILVTGTQRSGTTIVARIIASDLGYKYFDENAIGVSNVEKLQNLVKHDNIVIHCPAVSYKIHEFDGNDTAVVFVLRSKGDVLKSQKRIGWTGAREKRELKKYGASIGDCVYDVKLKFWREKQKSRVNGFEVQYESFASHPMFYSDRNGWANRQWRP